MSKEVDHLYENLLQRALEKNSSLNWLNLGYWDNAKTIEKACENMIALVADFGELANHQHLLDVGFGYGTQDIFLAKMFPHLKITGINIVEKQVDIAKAKVQEANLASQINFQLGDATHLSFQENTFDRIIAIEATFHFNTRKVFLENAFKLLKTGGILCLTEGLPNEAKLNDPFFRERSNFLGIPIENQYGIDEYVKKLRKIGFTSIKFSDISEAVIPYSAVVLKHQNGWRTNDEINLPTTAEDMQKLINSFKKYTTIDKYYIIKAKKE